MLIKKYLFIILGSISLGLGLLGIFLPVLPTTPFLLLSAALYMRSSSALYQWLITHPRLGTYILLFREQKALPLRIKIISITMLWTTILLSCYLTWQYRWIPCLLIAIAVAVTYHILSFKTLQK